MKKLTFILMLALLFGTAWANTGNVYHEVQVEDEVGNKVTDITSLYIYAPDTTTDAVIYMDRGLQNVITIPMTEASTNTTLVDGRFHWWGPDGWDFSMTNTDGAGPATNSGHLTRSSSEGRLVFPSYLTSINTAAYLDAESITMGTGSDWVINGGGVADTLSFTPASDDSTFNIGTSGTGNNSNFNVFVGSALGFKLSSSGGTHSMTYDGGIVNLNASSNFATNINTGTSTGAISLGSGTSGAFAVDTTTTVAINADDSFALTVSAGTIGIAATGGDITIDGVDKSVIIRGTEAIADAIWLDADAGGVDITAAATFDIDITATGGKILMNATEDAAGAISATVNGGTSETIVLTNTQGTGEDAFNIDATAGGIDIDFATAKDMAVTGGQFIFTSNEDVASAFSVITNTGSAETITLSNVQGTDDASVLLSSTAGGITLNAAAGSVDIEAVGGTDGDIGINAGDDMTVTVAGNLAYAVTGTTIFTNEVSSTAGFQSGAVTVTATTDGLTTGLIPSGTAFVTVTSDTATKVVVLPAAVIGNVIRITVPATGAELQTLDTTNETINAVDCDGTNEMAMAAGSVYVLTCTKAITWVAYGWGGDGAAQATIVPDAD